MTKVLSSQVSGDVLRLPLLSSKFYALSATEVAQKVLGKILISCINGKVTAGLIVETEAYLSAHDPASHAAKGQTQRNRSMFASGGTAYVYLCYGMYHCFNIVTGPAGVGEAVLVRALEPLVEIETMIERRYSQSEKKPDRTPLGRKNKSKYHLSNGPGKLTLALGIDLRHDGVSLVDPTAPLRLVDPALPPSLLPVGVSPRIGISQGTSALLRFFVEGSPWVSRFPQKKQKP